MKAKIKDEAYQLYLRQVNKQFSSANISPKTYIEFGETIKKYTGVVMKVSRQYGGRSCLTYPVPENNVVGIDIENYLLDFIEE